VGQDAALSIEIPPAGVGFGKRGSVRFLDAAPNPKARVALTGVYATGMRVSEVAAIEIRSIDSGRMVSRMECPG
jgi:hypothetical protein